MFTPYLQILGELPEHCVFTLVYSLPIYWLAGLNEAPERFLLNFLLVWLMVYCSRAMALFVAASLPTLQTSAFMGNSLFTVFYLTGGFVINMENMWLGGEVEMKRELEKKGAVQDVTCVCVCVCV